jgi:hypothetical protein
LFRLNNVGSRVKKWFLFCLLFICFFFDIFFLSLLHKHLVYLVLSIYIAQVYAPQFALLPLIITALLIGLESCMVYGHFGLQFVYLLPATLIGLWAKNSFYAPRLQPYLLLVLCLFAHALFMDKIPGTLALFGYTKSQISVNLIVLWGLIQSLKNR